MNINGLRLLGKQHVYLVVPGIFMATLSFSSHANNISGLQGGRSEAVSTGEWSTKNKRNIVDQSEIVDPQNLWPEGVVYYTFDNDLSVFMRMAFLEAVRDFRKDTNGLVVFVPRNLAQTHTYSYVYVQDCDNRNGYIGRYDLVHMGYPGTQPSTHNRSAICLIHSFDNEGVEYVYDYNETKFMVGHQLMHVLGFSDANSNLRFSLAQNYLPPPEFRPPLYWRLSELDREKVKGAYRLAGAHRVRITPNQDVNQIKLYVQDNRPATSTIIVNEDINIVIDDKPAELDVVAEKVPGESKDWMITAIARQETTQEMAGVIKATLTFKSGGTQQLELPYKFEPMAYKNNMVTPEERMPDDKRAAQSHRARKNRPWKLMESHNKKDPRCLGVEDGQLLNTYVLTLKKCNRFPPVHSPWRVSYLVDVSSDEGFKAAYQDYAAGKPVPFFEGPWFTLAHKNHADFCLGEVQESGKAYLGLRRCETIKPERAKHWFSPDGLQLKNRANLKARLVVKEPDNPGDSPRIRFVYKDDELNNLHSNEILTWNRLPENILGYWR